MLTTKVTFYFIDIIKENREKGSTQNWFFYFVWNSSLCSFSDIEQIMDSDLNSDVSLPSQLSSHSSDGSLFMSTSESSYNSDQSSGNNESRDSGYAVYEESSDEVDFLLM